MPLAHDPFEQSQTIVCSFPSRPAYATRRVAYAGTRQCRRLNASRNTGAVATVSALALIDENPTLESLDQ